MKPDVEHIFDDNACLTSRQIKDYLSATMSTEEIEAVESHFSVCPLCREAMDGYLAHSDKAVDTLASLDTHFLKEQIGNVQQQHPAKPVPVLSKPARKRKGLYRPPSFNSLVHIILIGGMFILFQRELNKPLPHRALTNTARAAAHAENVVTKGLAEAKTDPPPASAEKQYPEAPVGRNLKLQGAVNVTVPTNSDTGHAVVAAKLMTQPVVIQQIPIKVIAQPVGSTSVTTAGSTSVTASPVTAARPAAARPVTSAQPGASAPAQHGAQDRDYVVGSNGEIEEPDIEKTPSKKVSKPIGPPVDNAISQPTTNKPASPAGPDKPKPGNDKSKADDDWLWQ